MTRATVIIGSGFGDCGKGNVVSFYSAYHGGDSIVCRFNGGSNAGHTVVEPNGNRFVFGHFGSGCLTGAKTYLSRHFIVNPFLWKKELVQLWSMGISPKKLFIDSRANLTTPYDMILNQAVERFRGNSRHGSCGVGINETVERCTVMPTTVADLSDMSTFRDRLEFIRRQYVPDRIATLGLPSLDREAEFLLDSDVAIQSYLWTADELYKTSYCEADPYVLKNKNVIFEGAQGLLLDQNHHYFPHVTRSNTGLANVMEIADEAGINGLDVNYVTRTYMTRHGAGPFPTEDPHLRFRDETNVPNDWQGSLRFGHLDIDLLSETIMHDYGVNSIKYPEIDVKGTLAVTCMDQINDNMVYRLDGKYHIMTDETLKSVLSRSLPFTEFLFSYGPTRETIEERSISAQNEAWA